MPRQILIDNDALLKLARYGLLDAAVELFGSSYYKARVLASAQYVLLPAKNRLKLCKDEASADRLEDFLKRSLSLVEADVKPSWLDALNAVVNIDAGEALLLAVGASDCEALVITGDKKALVALSTDSTVSHIADSLSGRLITLEVVFYYLVEQQFEFIQSCIRSNIEVDKALSIIFGGNSPSTIDSVREGLSSYIKHLQRLTGTLLLAPSS